MEPTSAITATVLAAATLLPVGHPHIEVCLRMWENKTSKKVEFYKVEKISALQCAPVKPSVIQLDPGSKKLDTLIYSEQKKENFVADSLRVAHHPSDAPHNYLNLRCIYYEFGSFQIGCVYMKCENRVSSLRRLLDECMRWERTNPPQYIFIEIDGIIESEDLSNSTFKVEHEIFRLEKLK